MNTKHRWWLAAVFFIPFWNGKTRATLNAHRIHWISIQIPGNSSFFKWKNNSISWMLSLFDCAWANVRNYVLSWRPIYRANRDFENRMHHESHDVCVVVTCIYDSVSLFFIYMTSNVSLDMSSILMHFRYRREYICAQSILVSMYKLPKQVHDEPY